MKTKLVTEKTGSKGIYRVLRLSSFRSQESSVNRENARVHELARLKGLNTWSLNLGLPGQGSWCVAGWRLANEIKFPGPKSSTWHGPNAGFVKTCERPQEDLFSYHWDHALLYTWYDSLIHLGLQ